MMTPRDRLKQLISMLSDEDLVQIQDDPDEFAAQSTMEEELLDPSEGIRAGASIEAPGGVVSDMVRLSEILRKFDQDKDEDPSDNDVMFAEAIVRPLTRPAVLVQENSFDVKHRNWLHLNNKDADARKHILAAIPSVGRINVPSDWSVPYAGTGFVVGRNLLMTNRHVAELFSNGLGQDEVALKPGAVVNIDFKAEYGSYRRQLIRIEGVRMIHPYWDMALLEVEGVPDEIGILSLSQEAPASLINKEVVALGYPAFDPRNDGKVQNDLFKRIYNVKRMQPGLYTGQSAIRSFNNRVLASCHDCSTLGGNSGTGIVDLRTGHVVGLHFAGIYKRSNYAVPTSELVRDPYIVKAGVEFAPKATIPDGNPWKHYWSATESPAAQQADAPASKKPAMEPTLANLQVSTCAGEDGTAELSLNVPIRLTVGFDLNGATGGSQSDIAAPATERMVEPRHDRVYDNRAGYDREFLGLHVPMPVATNDDELSRQKDEETELRYHNFSIIMNARRRLAQITASNIDASAEAKEPEPGFTYTRRELNGFSSRNDREKWFLDPRIPAGDQLPDKFYTYDRTAFDKGHLVRREAVAFGTTFEEVQMANGDTFHSTNCSPQVKGYNRSGLGGIWGKLENDVLESAETTRCVVFSGPVFSDADREFHGRDLSGDTIVQIPARYWKMIVTRDGDALRTFAYVLEQDLSDVDFEFAKAGNWMQHQIEPVELERLLGNVTFPHLLSGSDKMSAEEWQELVSDPETSEEEIMEVSIFHPGVGAFDFRIAPDPRVVHLPPDAEETENAMAVANDLARSRRAAAFKLRTLLGNNDPVLVSEMDSWGQFPILIREVVDHLNKNYRVWSVGAAGDTAQNMVLGPQEPGKTEYMLALNEQREDVKGFVFSAAGNDIIGEDPDTGIPVLTDLLLPFNGNPADVSGHINHALLEDRLNFLRGIYRKVITDIRADADFQTLPIFIHGYDYPFPYPWMNDHRSPIHAAKDKWLGRPFAERGIHDNSLRRDILIEFINRLYEMLAEFSGDSKITRVWLVDCRGAMPNLTDWVDEIHGTSNGFRKVTKRFKTCMDEAGI